MSTINPVICWVSAAILAILVFWLCSRVSTYRHRPGGRRKAMDIDEIRLLKRKRH